MLRVPLRLFRVLVESVFRHLGSTRLTARSASVRQAPNEFVATGRRLRRVVRAAAACVVRMLRIWAQRRARDTAPAAATFRAITRSGALAVLDPVRDRRRPVGRIGTRSTCPSRQRASRHTGSPSVSPSSSSSARILNIVLPADVVRARRCAGGRGDWLVSTTSSTSSPAADRAPQASRLVLEQTPHPACRRQNPSPTVDEPRHRCHRPARQPHQSFVTAAFVWLQAAVVVRLDHEFRHAPPAGIRIRRGGACRF